MKKFDFEEETVPNASIESHDENLPTAVYTIYNVHGEPIGHRLYSYQPVYEPEEEEIIHHSEGTSEYEDSGEEGDELSHATILKGGLFDDNNLSTDGNAENINRLKHEYFEKYIDKRHKRYLNKNSNESRKEFDLELEEDENKSDLMTTSPTEVSTKARRKRDIHIEESDTNNWTPRPTAQDSESSSNINLNLLKVVPLYKHVYISGDNMTVIPLKQNYETESYKKYTKEVAVVPLQYNKTNSTEVDNVLDKREKKTSRKTDRLNQTTATVPKT